MDTKNGTGGIARNISATLQSLQTENEQLRAGYDAARQEIASLRAQPYDQQAMGLCHVCGWKGVIDYPDGPVCVACEHDKALSPQPTAQAQELVAPDDRELEDLVHAANQEALSYGVSLDVFMRLAKTVRLRAATAAQQGDAA